jgi:glycosyltransferase involved in cell wall biosynthesis
VRDSVSAAKHTVTVILSSYNQPKALRLGLAAYAAQDDRDFDLLIADDGSDEDVIREIESAASELRIPVTLITRPHKDFGKPEILNIAVARSKGEQIVFSDGDCVPFRNFVRTHREHYRPDGFCTGGYVRIRMPAAAALTPEEVAHGRHEMFLNSRQKRHLHGIHYKNLFYLALGFKSEPKIQGGNVSVPRGAFEEINGFDEAYRGFSKSDSDLRNRLRNAGFKGTSLWNKAFVCHLDHAIDPLRHTPESRRVKPEKEFYLEGRSRTRAEAGLDGHLGGKNSVTVRRLG